MVSKSNKTKITPLRKPIPCPQCGQHSKRNSYPFCSKRCTELDLGAWLSGRYALAVEEQDLRLPKE